MPRGRSNARHSTIRKDERIAPVPSDSDGIAFPQAGRVVIYLSEEAFAGREFDLHRVVASSKRKHPDDPLKPIIRVELPSHLQPLGTNAADNRLCFRCCIT